MALKAIRVHNDGDAWAWVGYPRALDPGGALPADMAAVGPVGAGCKAGATVCGDAGV